MQFTNWVEKVDSEWGIPRHANHQSLPAYQAFWHFSGDVLTSISTIVCGIISSIFLYVTMNLLEVSFGVRLFFYMGIVAVLLIGCAEAAAVQIPYMRVFQLTTYGSARWADIKDLKDNLVRKIGSTIPAGWIVLGKFRGKYNLVLPVEQWLRHIVIFGVSGSGKSKTFLMWFLRYVLRGGSFVAIDPKPELYPQTAHYAKRVFRLDLKDPSYSDRWNFVPRCKDDPEFAHAMAGMMIGLEKQQQSKADPFWGEAEHVACTAILMFLGTIIEHPTPPMVYEYVCLRDDEGFATDMSNCEHRPVRMAWRAFLKAPRQTQGSVMIGLSNKLHPFSLENVQAVCAPLTEKDRMAGAQDIDFATLREPGTGIYIVIPEGAATRYKTVLATFIGQAVMFLRDSDKGGTKSPTMFLIDEAYNVPVSDIKQISGVGRERGMGLCLCYQNVAQVHDQHGRDGGNAILETLVNKLFLPGLNDSTAKYASDMLGKTTTLSRTTVDAPGKKYDNVRASETGRALRDPTEFRTMPKHKQAILITDTAPPIKFAFPPIAIEKNVAVAPLFGKPTVVTFEEAEKASLEQRRKGAKKGGQTTPADAGNGAKSKGARDHSEATGGAGKETKDPRDREWISQPPLWDKHIIEEETHDALDEVADKVREPRVIKKTIGDNGERSREDAILNHGREAGADAAAA